MFQVHFAWIDTEFLYNFEHTTGIISIIQFIKESSYKEFKIYLNEKSDIDVLDYELKQSGYKNKSEWLREKMRNEIKFIKR